MLKKFGKDKKFCKWFIRHRKELALPYGNTYNVTTIREAYKTGRPLDEVKHFLFPYDAGRQFFGVAVGRFAFLLGGLGRVRFLGYVVREYSVRNGQG